MVPGRVPGPTDSSGYTWEGRTERPRARRDDDRPRGERAQACCGLHLHRPGGGDFCLALDALDTKAGIALGRVVRLDRSHDTLHALHDRGGIESHPPTL